MLDCLMDEDMANRAINQEGRSLISCLDGHQIALDARNRRDGVILVDATMEAQFRKELQTSAVELRENLGGRVRTRHPSVRGDAVQFQDQLPLQGTFIHFRDHVHVPRNKSAPPSVLRLAAEE